MIDMATYTEQMFVAPGNCCNLWLNAYKAFNEVYQQEISEGAPKEVAFNKANSVARTMMEGVDIAKHEDLEIEVGTVLRSC